MCPGLESNQHDLAVTAPSRRRVYQFRHLGLLQDWGLTSGAWSGSTPNTRPQTPILCEGDPARARTWDPLIKSQMLYQLSYEIIS